jgi:hypothetical protein
MTRSCSLRSRVILALSVLVVLGVSRVHAQTLQSDASVPAMPAAIPALMVNVQPFDAQAPAGVRLGLVAEVVGVSVVLEQASGTSQSAVAQIRLRSTAAIGAMAFDGFTAFGDSGPLQFVPIDTVLACGDATWQPTLAGETAADPQSSQLFARDRHGLWRVAATEMTR